MRTCDRYREALSARLDGEDPGMPLEQIDAHVEGCVECHAWAVAAGGLSEHMAPRYEPAPPGWGTRRPARPSDPRRETAAIPHGVAGRPRSDRRRAARHRMARRLPGRLARRGTHRQRAHVLGSRPRGWFPTRRLASSRAWGALPVIAVMVALLTWTSVADLVTGRAEPTREAVHALQVAGLGCVWALSRCLPRSSVVLRIKSTA
jgi:Putative zinc-finger